MPPHFMHAEFSFSQHAFAHVFISLQTAFGKGLCVIFNFFTHI